MWIKINQREFPTYELMTLFLRLMAMINQRPHPTRKLDVMGATQCSLRGVCLFSLYGIQVSSSPFDPIPLTRPHLFYVNSRMTVTTSMNQPHIKNLSPMPPHLHYDAKAISDMLLTTNQHRLVGPNAELRQTRITHAVSNSLTSAQSLCGHHPLKM